jgi:5'-nucleotidase
MSRARRTIMVVLVILAILATPGLISFTEADPPQSRVQAPRTGEKASLRSGEASVRLLGVNDFHGNLESPFALEGRAVGGAAYLAAYLDRYAKNPENTIRVHAGDMVGASPLVSGYFHDEPTVYAMNEMNFDVGTLGNHELDEGGEEMLRLINGGQRTDGEQFKDNASGQPVNTSDPNFPGTGFPYVAANTLRKRSAETVLPPHMVEERDGVKVGFIGVTTEDTPDIVMPEAVEPFRILDISETVNRYAAELRREKGVEAIVVLAHAGGHQKGAAEATGEIVAETREMSDAVDVVIAGHSHNRLNVRIEDKLVVEAHFGPEIAGRLMGFFTTLKPAAPSEVFPELTAREAEVLDLVAQGRSNAEIARRLYLS